MDADGVEEFLPEEFCEFLGAVDPVDEDDELVEGEGVEEVREFFELLVLSEGEVPR